MNYAQARSKFKNGDVVFFAGGKKNIIRHAITWFTNGPHYHVAIAFWARVGETKRLLISEATPDGYRVTNLSFYAARDMTVFRCPVPWGAIQGSVEGTNNVAYSFLDILVIGLHEKFGMPLPEASDVTIPGAASSCSVVVARLLKGAGATGIEIMVSPEKLLAQLSRHHDPVMKVVGKF